MTDPRRASRVAAIALAASVMVAACGEQSRVAPDAAINVTGSVLLPGGSAAAKRPVKLGTGVSEGDGAFAILTLGLACTTGICTGNVRDALTDEAGRYAFTLKGSDTQSSFGEAVSVLVSASGPVPEGDVSGPMSSARFRVQAETLELPQLELIDPGLALSDADGVVATWSTTKAGPYELSYENGTDVPVWLERTTESTARVDSRLLEDTAGRVVVAGQVEETIEGSKVEVRWRSPGAPYASGVGAPPSRGRTCRYVDSTGAVAEAGGQCGLTDGDLATQSPIAVTCPTTTPEAPCPTPVAAIIDLGEPLPAELAVIRGCEGGCAIEASADGSTFQPVGSASDGFGSVGLNGEPVRALKVGLGSGTGLREVSVWGPAPATSLIAVDDEDRSDLAAPYSGAGGAGTGRPSLALILVAVAAIAALLLGMGVLLGRRQRSRLP
ncbi:MAG: hypothetical protein ACOYXM_03105 [Actinomycetota bacterium]